MTAALKPPVLIRADAGNLLGFGHVMRMIALAQALTDRGIKAVFVSVQCCDSMLARTKAEGFTHRLLADCALGSDADAEQTLSLAHEFDCRWIFLDGYYFGLKYQRLLHTAGFKVAVMEDTSYCENWSADLIINQNIGTETKDYNSCVDNFRTLTGTRYTLLRREFQSKPTKKENPDGDNKNILITMGGVDPDNASSQILKALEVATSSKLTIRILVGGENPHVLKLYLLASESIHDVELLKNVSEMPAMYSWADGVISASGSTCYEWLLYKKHAAVVVIAENQELIAKELHERKCAVVLGRIGFIEQRELVTLLQDWLENIGQPPKLNFPLLDPWGARRLSACLDDKNIWVRPTEFCDSKNYFRLVNDPLVRKNSLNSQSVSWKTHQTWFSEHLHKPSDYMYAAFDSTDNFIGQVRFNLQKAAKPVWRISYSLRPEFRGKSLSKPLLQLAMNELTKTNKLYGKFLAEIRLENIPSIKTFKSLGFAQDLDLESSHKGTILYSKRNYYFRKGD